MRPGISNPDYVLRQMAQGASLRRVREFPLEPYYWLRFAGVGATTIAELATAGDIAVDTHDATYDNVTYKLTDAGRKKAGEDVD